MWVRKDTEGWVPARIEIDADVIDARRLLDASWKTGIGPSKGEVGKAVRSDRGRHDRRIALVGAGRYREVLVVLEREGKPVRTVVVDPKVQGIIETIQVGSTELLDGDTVAGVDARPSGSKERRKSNGRKEETHGTVLDITVYYLLRWW